MLSVSVNHIPGTVDACPLDGRMYLRLRAARGALSSVKLLYNCDKNRWHQFRLEAPMEIAFTDSELVYYSVSVPLTDTRFAYIFELTCSDGKRRYYSEEGLSDTYDHSLGYFNFFQYTSQFPCDAMTVPEWVRTAVCYQIFPERFAMGDPHKDTGYITNAWGTRPTPKSFFGGDLYGMWRCAVPSWGRCWCCLPPMSCPGSGSAAGIPSRKPPLCWGCSPASWA